MFCHQQIDLMNIKTFQILKLNKDNFILIGVYNKTINPLKI